MAFTKAELNQVLADVTDMTNKLSRLTDNDNLTQIAQQLMAVKTNQTIGENLTVDEGLDIAERAIKNFTPADTPEIDRWLERVLELSRLLAQIKRKDQNE